MIRRWPLPQRHARAFLWRAILEADDRHRRAELPVFLQATILPDLPSASLQTAALYMERRQQTHMAVARARLQASLSAGHGSTSLTLCVMLRAPNTLPCRRYGVCEGACPSSLHDWPR